ncbi:MAG: hypothetical protein ACRD1N_10625 [Terriglobia bacterium]
MEKHAFVQERLRKQPGEFKTRNRRDDCITFDHGSISKPDSPARDSVRFSEAAVFAGDEQFKRLATDPYFAAVRPNEGGGGLRITFAEPTCRQADA